MLLPEDPAVAELADNGRERFLEIVSDTTLIVACAGRCWPRAR